MLKRTSRLKQKSRLKSHSQLKNSTDFEKNLQKNEILCNSNNMSRPRNTINHEESNPEKVITERPKYVPSSMAKASLLSEFEMPRIKNQAVIAACRKDRCEYCGRPAGGEPHHIISRGTGGPDAVENLVQLCGTCHRAVHAGKIDEKAILWIVAHRLNSTPTKLKERIWEIMRVGR